ncbi:YchJ family protein [Actinomadura rupiterrae]|uniref:YchJ family protein n=1 Tax=Actinomadura rupiterrae TaxID=559627 RepID=UPI0020A55DAD|nr:YchJ family metal-binding protein [Actinomadura rupiterrae]MCP2341570.1 SEC-C motif-containing protein [Actinomadura rupiterrae]
MPKRRSEPCPCGSGVSYRDCCGRLHRGEAAAETAEQLMRSRFSAFVKLDDEYLMRSWHPATRPESLEFEPGLYWERLEIVRTADGAPGDNRGVVEFRAHFVQDGQRGRLHEVSRFVRHDDAWVYVNGRIDP